LTAIAAPPPLDLTRRDVVEALLRRYRLRPDRRLGQNFLVDARALDMVVEAAELSSDDAVLEIGAGLGTLTQQLARRAARVVAVEYDRRLAPVLRETIGDDPRIEIVMADILSLDWASRMGAAPFQVVANIPYQITSHLIRRLLESPKRPGRMILTVQREVAERVLAAPGEMSLLALGVQAYGSPRLMGSIPAAAFYPAPRVDSAILRVDVRPAAGLPESTQSLFRLARAGFSQPRKKLRNAMSAGLRLAPRVVEANLRHSGISPDARAEDLSLVDWERLASAWDAEKEG
jgi:16S rRNA (adenine1518-N6/adenine1519-N6)-dimethyltransferase